MSRSDEIAEVVTLPVGSYLIEARSERGGYVRVGVVIKAGKRTIKGELCDFEQSGRIDVGIVIEREHDGVIDGLFADLADAGVSEPEQGMPPVKDLKECLKAVDPDIAAAQVNQFVKQDGAKLFRGKALDQ